MVRARQVAAATGILAYISGFVGSLALGSNQPGATDSVESVQSYIARYGFGIYMHHTFSALDSALVLCFAVFLCAVLRQAEGESGIFATIAMAGAAVAVATDLVVLALHSATFVSAANTVDLRVLATAGIERAHDSRALPMGGLLRRGRARFAHSACLAWLAG